MAGNKVLDHARKQMAARRGGPNAGVGQTVDYLADSAPAPSQALENREVVDIVRARLTQEERQLLDFWMEGNDWNEVARRGGLAGSSAEPSFTRSPGSRRPGNGLGIQGLGNALHHGS